MRLVLFSGLPGVGKTTVSNSVGKLIDAVTVDIDDFKRNSVDGKLVKSQIDPPEIRWGYYQKALSHVLELFNSGAKRIILDEVFHLSSLRSKIEGFCAENGVKVVWVEVLCDYKVVEGRLNSVKREGHLLSTQEALSMHLMFKEIFESFPFCSRNHIVVDNERGVDCESLSKRILDITL